MSDKILEMFEYLRTPRVNLIRHESESSFNLCAQFPMHWLDENMNDVAAPLLAEVGGEKGLGYTAWFKWEDYEKVRAFFEGIGYLIHDKDERERDRELAKMLTKRP